MTFISSVKTFFLISSLVFLSACSSINSHTSKASIKARKTNDNIVAIDLKALASLEKIASRLAKHRTVFVGEMHTSYSDHLNQLATIKTLHKQWGKKTSIGLEMVQQPYQKYLDEYISGKITEKQMLKGTQWYKRWQYDFRLYRPIFDYAKQHKIPMVALNIPAELTKRITKVGISKLSPQERKQLPAVIDRSNPVYIKRIKDVFGGHAHTRSKGFDKFLDAQLGWDEGMAFATSKYLKKHPKKNMVILAGGGHVVNYEGIPSRLDRQIGTKSAVVLNNIDGDNLAKSGDYLLFSPAKKLPAIGRFGIAMENTKNQKGVIASKVSLTGAAGEAGLKKGDIIIGLNKHIINDSLDLKLFAEQSQPNDKVTIKALRGTKILLLKAVLKGNVPFLRHR